MIEINQDTNHVININSMNRFMIEYVFFMINGKEVNVKFDWYGMKY